jgi:hypothetical protein
MTRRSLLAVLVLLAGCMAGYAPRPGTPLAGVTFINSGYTPVSMYHEACGEPRPSTMLASLRRGQSQARSVTANEPFSFTFYAPIGEDWSCGLGFLTFTPIPGERYEIEFTQTGSGPPASCSVALYRGERKVREPLSDCRAQP